MICAKCSGETKVVNSRPHRDDATVIQRRRACDGCGHRFNTFESTIDAVATRARKRRDNASFRAGQTAEQMAARYRRARLRQQARAEAAETGRPLDQILTAWGVA